MQYIISQKHSDLDVIICQNKRGGYIQRKKIKHRHFIIRVLRLRYIYVALYNQINNFVPVPFQTTRMILILRRLLCPSNPRRDVPFFL